MKKHVNNNIRLLNILKKFLTINKNDEKNNKKIK